jgi:hypothetical protein
MIDVEKLWQEWLSDNPEDVYRDTIKIEPSL